MALTDTAIRNAKAGTQAKRLSDGGALFLEVRPTGAKIWLYRFRLNGKPNIYTIGRYYDSGRTINGKPIPPDHIGIAKAREERDIARALVKRGFNPTDARERIEKEIQTASANTFESVAREWIDSQKHKWVAPYLQKVERALDKHVYPEIGKLPIKEVKPAHVKPIIEGIAKGGAKTTALLVRMWCKSIVSYAVDQLKADVNTLAGALVNVVERDKVKHKTPLSRDEIPAFLTKADANANRTTAIALRLVLLTFVRPGELRAAEWTEFDLDRAEWRIPAGKMKKRELHIVPLSDQAVTLLRELHTITGSGRYLFPNKRSDKAHMSHGTLNVVLTRMGYAGRFSAHGFRATAATFLNELGYRADLIERQLAHKERDETRASYNQAEYMPERKRMMQQWADFIDSLANGGKVVPIRAA